MRIPLSEAAIPYLRMGWKVFPVSRDKIPLTEHGRNDATGDLNVIREWEKRYPGANIAIATGKESNLVVIDIDGPTGLENFRRLIEKYEIQTHGPLVKTRNGYHLYFFHRGHCPTSVGRLGKNIDVRGFGGSITAPPSIHRSGFEYRWIRPLTDTLPKLPLALYPLLYKPQAIIHKRLRPHCEDIERLKDILQGAPKGERNWTLNRVAFIAGRMVREGKIDWHTAYQELFQVAQSIGLERKEIAATIRSGLRSGSGGINVGI